MIKHKYVLSIIPLIGCLLLLSDFIIGRELIATEVTSKKIYKRDYYLKLGTFSTEVNQRVYDATTSGDSARIIVGEYSDTLLSFEILNDSRSSVIISYEAKAMIIVLGGITLFLILSFFDFKDIERKTKREGISLLLWVFWGVSLFPGYILAIKLALVEYGIIDKF